MTRIYGFLALSLLAAAMAISLVHWSRICLSTENPRESENPPAITLSAIRTPQLQSGEEYSFVFQHVAGTLGIFFAASAMIVTVLGLYGAISCSLSRRRANSAPLNTNVIQSKLRSLGEHQEGRQSSRAPQPSIAPRSWRTE